MDNIDRIIQWANNPLQHRLSIEGNVPVKTSVGFAIVRSSGRTVFCKRARMILQRNRGADFYILTAYPLP
jgi:hypothetical protein